MKKNRIIIIWVAYVLLLLAYFGITYVFANPGKAFEFSLLVTTMSSVDSLITLTSFLIAGIVFFTATARLNLLNRFTSDLRNAADRIDQQSKEENCDLHAYYTAGENRMFENDILQSQYEKYCEESERLSADGSYKCDISDYIDRSVIDVRTNRNMLNTIPSVMTGLGILGTFIGLYLGLQGFRTGSAGEITESITPLMEGIKVAFSTSIIGMVFSLVFNFIYRKSYEDAYRAADDFILMHDKHISGNPVYDNQNQLLSMLNAMPSRISTENDQKLADEQSQAYALVQAYHENSENLQATRKAVEGISVSLGQSLAGLLEPQFEKMNTTLDDLAKNISQHSADAIDQSAKAFVESMMKALNGSFDELGKTLNQTAEMQNKNNEMLNTLMAHFNEVNAFSEKVSEQMASFSEKLEAYQKSSAEYMETVTAQFEDLKKADTALLEHIDGLTEVQKNMISTSVESTEKMSEGMTSFAVQMAEHQKRAADVTKSMTEDIGAGMQTYMQKLAEHNESVIANTKAVNEEMTAGMQEYMNSLTEQGKAVTEQTKNMTNEIFNGTQTYLEKLSEHHESVMNQAKDATKEMSEGITECMDRLTDQNHKAVEAMAHAMGTYTEQMAEKQKDMIESMNKTALELFHAAEEMKAFRNTLTQATEDTLKAMKIALEKQLAQANDLSKGTAEDLNRAAEHLSQVTDRLSDEVDHALDKTLAVFDQKLASITRHLSATIAEIRDTTNRVPETVAAAYEGMDKTLTQMKANMDELAAVMKKTAQSLNDRS